MLSLILALLLQQPIEKKNELDYCKEIAEREHWAVEVVLWDKSRVDLVSDQYVIEVDYAYKWKEAIGQALYYEIADPTEKKPAILLLAKTDDDRHIYRAQSVCAKHDIHLIIERIK